MSHDPSHDGPRARPVDWPLRLWLLSATVSVLILVAIGAAWMVRMASLAPIAGVGPDQARRVMRFAALPTFAHQVLQEARWAIRGLPGPLLIDRASTELPQWVRRFPAPEDPGYLLLSALDPERKQSIVSLVRVADGAVLARWVPDWVEILGRTSEKHLSEKPDVGQARAIHPLLLDDGDIIFDSWASLVRMNRCSRRPVWLLDETMHHSVEPDADRRGVWVPAQAEDGFRDNPWLAERVRDDALGHVSLDGRLLGRPSLVRILRENGLEPLLLGQTGPTLAEDPIHLNEIVEATADSRHWMRGDLLISARHLSAVFLYRPSTGRILWHRVGPWMNQHAVQFVDDHRISVFDNHVIAGAPKAHAFVAPGDANRVYVYDFDTDSATQPYEEAMKRERLLTIAEGRAQLLPDGRLFVEETNAGRQVMLSPQGRLLWSRVNDYDAQYLGQLGWSRYLAPDEARAALSAIQRAPCASAPSGS